MTYQYKIKEKRLSKGFTQQQMADKLGVTLRTYRRYENVEYPAPYDALHRIKKLL